ncbi:hypothetical protein D3C77_506750 [compost metagenome]
MATRAGLSADTVDAFNPPNDPKLIKAPKLAYIQRLTNRERQPMSNSKMVVTLHTAKGLKQFSGNDLSEGFTEQSLTLVIRAKPFDGWESAYSADIESSGLEFQCLLSIGEHTRSSYDLIFRIRTVEPVTIYSDIN